MDASMDLEQTANSACAICGGRSVYHRSWYLVMEDPRLDRLKVLSWHPVLAEQSAMHSVCGKRHLELLVTHWLTYADLRIEGATTPESSLADHEYGPGEGINLPYPGQLVGELAVHREPVSRCWTGSAESLENIFEALAAAAEALQVPPQEVPAEVEFTVAEFVVAPPDRAVRLGDYVGSTSTA